jgi:hypothetical protein
VRDLPLLEVFVPGDHPGDKPRSTGL